MIWSVVIPSDSARKLTRTRWRITGWAIDLMSSKLTWYRPLVRARALPPSTRYCAARTLAPNETYFLTRSVAFFALGRLVRTIDSA